ncbi:hypothetical protein G7Y79_00033g068100 [Physcia stellaris]|nr:hypothetical protein G7Y79_00033g068100 [Physcia stellaris]
MTSSDGQRIKKTLKKLLPGSEEKYVPLPYGGYGLPAIVRRKFSFPAQLPNISTLSLLPDFNSPRHDHLDKGLASQHQAQTTPNPHHPLRIRYSLTRSLESINEAEQRQPTPSLRRISKRISKPDSLMSIQESEGSSEDDGFASQSGSFTDATTAINITPSVSPCPESIIRSIDTRDSQTPSPGSRPTSDTNRASSKSRFPSVRDQITLKLESCVPNLLREFCIIDLQLEGTPIAVVTQDLLPAHHLDRNEAHFLTGPLPETTFQICVQTHASGETYSVILQGDFYSCSSDFRRPTHRFIANLDLTPYVESVRRGANDIWRYEPQDPDIWLELAHDETGSPIPTRYEAKRVSKKDRLDIAMEVLTDLYRDFFVLGIVDAAHQLYEMTHVSRSVFELDRESCKPPDLPSLVGRLQEGECFYADLEWGGRRRVYCIPMYGPKLNSWLCFLVERGVPVVW